VQARGVALTSHVAPLDAQLAHVAPPEPHALPRNPASHVPAWSQHPAQLAGPHGAGVTHSCPAQTVPPLHVPHAWPPLPHAASCVPVTHTPPRQHPEHVPGPHVGSQNPSTHCVPEGHAWHCTPKVPHTASVSPVKHVVPAWSQQPPQLDGPQGADVHVPLVQFVPVPHARHSPP
jgi:hypothetical protein